jgi:hypothetical protein
MMALSGKPLGAGSRLVFGNLMSGCPALPDGWRYLPNPADWLLVVSPSGDSFFVLLDAGQLVLVPRRIASEEDVERSQGRLALGAVFGDFENPVRF